MESDEKEQLKNDDEEEDVEELNEDEVEEAEASLALAGDEDEEADEASLEALLAQRASARRASSDESESDDIMALTSEKEPKVVEVAGRVIPIKDRQEFVCNNCHLVKARSQLANAQRGLCRDCV